VVHILLTVGGRPAGLLVVDSRIAFAEEAIFL